jgi:hypothetical protein
MAATVVPFEAARTFQEAEALQAALTWLAGEQRSDGGFSNGFSDASDPGTTADIVVGLAAAGQDPAEWVRSENSPIDFLENSAADGFADGPGLVAKVVQAVLAAGRDPRSFGGQNLVMVLQAGFDASTGWFGGPYDTSLTLLGLDTAGEAIPEAAVERLVAARLEDGSYSFSGDRTAGAGDTNTTSLAVQSLLAVGRSEEIALSLEYFRSQQNDDGGWTYQKPSSFGEETDSNSTALVILALDAAGERLSQWGDPTAALLALQQPEGGFAYNSSTPGNNLLATVQVLPALAAAARQPPDPTEVPTETPILSTPTGATTGTPSTPQATATSVAPQSPGSTEGMWLAFVGLALTLGVALWLGRKSES